MKGLAIAALGLALLTARTSADEVQKPTLKLTTGNVVTILQLPAGVVGAAKKNWTKINATNVRRETNSATFTGDATFDSSYGLKMSADEIKLNTIGDEGTTSFSLSGKVVIEVQEDGKEVMRITADKALLEPQ